MESKNVQTVVPEATYERLAQLARRKKLSIKAALREAVDEYVRREAAAGDDPLMGLVGGGDLKADAWSTRKDWRA